MRIWLLILFSFLFSGLSAQNIGVGIQVNRGKQDEANIQSTYLELKPTFDLVNTRSRIGIIVNLGWYFIQKNETIKKNKSVQFGFLFETSPIVRERHRFSTGIHFMFGDLGSEEVRGSRGPGGTSSDTRIETGVFLVVPIIYEYKFSKRFEVFGTLYLLRYPANVVAFSGISIGVKYELPKPLVAEKM